MDRRITGVLVAGVSKVFRAYDPRQSYLLPPSPLDWLPEGHLAYFVLDVVGELDLSPIFAHPRESARLRDNLLRNARGKQGET